MTDGAGTHDRERFAFVTLAEAFYAEYEVPSLPVPFTPAEIATVLPNGQVPFSLVASNLLDFVREFPQAREVYAPLVARIAFEAGIFEGREGRTAPARRFLEAAAAFAPGNLTVRASLGRALLDDGDNETALATFAAVREALSREGFLPDVWLGGVAALDRLGRVAERDEWAQDLVRRVSRFFPEREADLFAYAAAWAAGLALSRDVQRYLAGHREA